MNEIRDLIIGIDFGKEYSQICYYDRKAGEPVSVPVKVGSSQVEIPACICKRAGQSEYYIGLEAEYFAREKDGVLLDNLYEISQQEKLIRLADEEKEPAEYLAVYLKGLLKFLGVMEIVKNTRALVITTPFLDPIQVGNWKKACTLVGFPSEKCYLMDYEESFFYYVFTQKKEIWNRNIAWYSFQGNTVTFRCFEMKPGDSPIQIRLTDPVSRELPVENSVRDAAFTRFIRDTIGTEVISSVHMNGIGFDQEWAYESVKLLCYQRRKVFYGNNLYARGACAAGMERKELKNLKSYRYMSHSLVVSNVGMEMRVMGAPAYYPLIQAGKSWYECQASCELILDDTEELIFSVTEQDGEKRKISMPLPGLPKRPNKTTRLSLELEYISEKECRITVKDQGFGDLYPSSGKVWKETTMWQGGGTA